MTGCITCDLGLDHCHAPILEHDDGIYECLEGCGGPRAIHDLVLSDGVATPAMSPTHPAVRAAAPSNAGRRPARWGRAA